MPECRMTMVSASVRSAPTTRLWVCLLWIIAASALGHLWCLGSQFYMDDMPAIRDNPAVRHGTLWLNLPTTWTHLGYVIQYQRFGVSPVGYHAVNWLLHTAVACVLFGLGRDLLGRQVRVAWFGALLFAVHPLASEIPNYARTQDLAWVTMFSLLGAWSLRCWLARGWWPHLAGCVMAMVGATISKGPGLFHAAMVVGVVGLASMTAAQGCAFYRRRWWVGGCVVIGVAALWAVARDSVAWSATRLWGDPRFIGHAYTLARVFWEFAWRSVIPVELCSDHHIAETLVPPGAHFWNIPDTGAIWAAVAMLAFAGGSLVLAWRQSSRVLGVCLFLYVATLLFRVLYLIPEFMPEYRIYPGLPWFCLGAAIALAAGWRAMVGGVSARYPAVFVLVVLAVMAGRRSWQWHDLDRLMEDVLRQYPAQGRAVWELHDRDLAAGNWQQVIDRQRTVWPLVFRNFLEENRRLAPQRELPSGHFALADVACAGDFAVAVAHVDGADAGLREIDRLEGYMRRLHLDPVEHKLHWRYFYRSKVTVLETAGNYKSAIDLMRQIGLDEFDDAQVARIRQCLTPGS